MPSGREESRAAGTKWTRTKRAATQNGRSPLLLRLEAVSVGRVLDVARGDQLHVDAAAEQH